MAHKLSSSEKLPTGTVTFLFIDVVGSTPLWENHPALMAEALDVHNNVLHSAIKAKGGMFFKTIGDALQVVFTTIRQDSNHLHKQSFSLRKHNSLSLKGEIGCVM